MKIWTPTLDYIKDSNLSKYTFFLEEKYGLVFDNYSQLHQWSIDNLEAFWLSLNFFFKIEVKEDFEEILKPKNADSFIGTQWFEGLKVSYSAQIFKNSSNTRPAIISKNEEGESVEMSWEELTIKTSAIRNYLRKAGVKKGDVVAGILNNSAETIFVFLAVNSLGAIWTCCSPDFGTESIVSRFQQVNPKILIANKEYFYNGKKYSKSETINKVANEIESLEDVLVINDLKWKSVLAINGKKKDLYFEFVDFNDPIWILFSSGTTGKPKAITHSTGGNLLEHLKALALHQNVKKGERFMWYSTTGWMMWNYALGSMLAGATLCIYDGSSNYPNLNVLWDFVEEEKIQHFGAGASFFMACQKANINLNQNSLITLGSTGSPLPQETFVWLQNQLLNTQIISLSGGTDVCSAFLTGCAWLPVYAGEIQCKALGVAAEVFSENAENIVGETGELVIVKPMPSMPLYFWGDENNTRYFESYFNKYTGKWCHGDWVRITENAGIEMLGRSDATLNRGGVRIGSAEIYDALSDLTEILDSLVITVDAKNGESKMYLFVKTTQKLELELEKKVKETLKVKCSPRYIPDFIVEVADIPYTNNGKKMELPIKKYMMGADFEKVIQLDTVKNPESLNFWKENY